MLEVISRMTITLVYFPEMADPTLNQDAWVAAMVGVLLAIPTVWVLNLLWLRFPTQNFAQVLETVLGKAVGKAVTLLYIGLLLIGYSVNLRMTGDFFIFAFLPRTPIIVVMGVMAALVAWAVKGGLEVIARMSQIIFPLLIASVLFVFALLFRDLDFNRLQPVFVQTGVIPIFRQAVSILARNVEFLWIPFLLPSMNRPQGLFKALLLVQLILGLLWMMMAVTVTGLLGSAQTSLYFPFFSATRMVSIADFLERVDAILLALWLLGMVVRTAMIVWALSVGTAQLLGLRDYRPVVLPLTGLALTNAVAQAESLQELRRYLLPPVYTPLMLTSFLVIPVLVWLIALIRNVRDRPSRSAKSPGMQGGGT